MNPYSYPYYSLNVGRNFFIGSPTPSFRDFVTAVSSKNHKSKVKKNKKRK